MYKIASKILELFYKRYFIQGSKRRICTKSALKRLHLVKLHAIPKPLKQFKLFFSALCKATTQWYCLPLLKIYLTTNSITDNDLSIMKNTSLPLNVVEAASDYSN